MKNLLAFTAVFAAGFLLGSRRATKPVTVIAEFKLRGRDFAAINHRHNYRAQVVEEPTVCRADIDALRARQDAGEALTDEERRTLYKYQLTA